MRGYQNPPTESTLVQALCKANRVFRIQTLFHSKIIIVKLIIITFIASLPGKTRLRNRDEFLIAKLDLFGLIWLSFGFTGRS